MNHHFAGRSVLRAYLKQDSQKLRRKLHDGSLKNAAFVDPKIYLQKAQITLEQLHQDYQHFHKLKQPDLEAYYAAGWIQHQADEALTWLEQHQEDQVPLLTKLWASQDLSSAQHWAQQHPDKARAIGLSQQILHHRLNDIQNLPEAQSLLSELDNQEDQALLVQYFASSGFPTQWLTVSLEPKERSFFRQELYGHSLHYILSGRGWPKEDIQALLAASTLPVEKQQELLHNAPDAPALLTAPELENAVSLPPLR